MKSIMQDKSEGMCYLCMKLHGDYHRRSNLEEHHVIYGKGNRKISEKYGLKVYLCHEHHNDPGSQEAVHFNRYIRHDLCRAAQRAFQKTFQNLDFTEIFGKNYLDEEDMTKQAGASDTAAGFYFLEEKQT